MPQRAFNLAVAVVGVLVLAAMIVVGVDWSRAARTGPAWRRRLICAVLWLLAAIGLSPAAPSSAVAQDTTAPASAPATSDLSKTKEWQSVIDAYAKIAPLTEAEHSTLVQRRAANAAVKAATAAMDHLRLRKQLDSTEVAIIRDDFARLQQLMNRTRPTDMNVTCYLVPVVKPAAKHRPHHRPRGTGRHARQVRQDQAGNRRQGDRRVRGRPEDVRQPGVHEGADAPAEGGGEESLAAGEGRDRERRESRGHPHLRPGQPTHHAGTDHPTSRQCQVTMSNV